MNKEELKSLFVKYHNGTATEEERSLLEAWYLQHNEAEPFHISAQSVKAVKNEVNRRLPGNQGEFLKIGIRLDIPLILTTQFRRNVTIDSASN